MARSVVIRMLFNTAVILVCNKAEGKCSILVLIDLSAVFDIVGHHTLLCDSENLGVTGLALSWFKTYLTDRNFKVIVNDEESEIGIMKYGAPQGTILGPKLFINYTLNLQYMLKLYNAAFYFYADDAQIYFNTRWTGNQHYLEGPRGLF